MKAPTCRLCGSEHWSGEPHRFAKAELPKTVKAEQVESRKVAQSEPVKLGFDRKAYQREYLREYMRKRRAGVKP